MFKKILLVLVVVIVLLAGFVVMQPADYAVERKITIAAPPAAIFAHVNDFHKWQAWSPWVKVDPNAKETFDGPSEGTGAIFRWAGNSDVGEGSMTILESQPAERIRIKLEFIKPMAGHCETRFTFQPQDEQTVVTWKMTGQNSFVCKAISLVCDVETMIGSKYEEGLANLKSIVETKAK